MEIDYKKYKHISFDLWLTLIKSNPEFKLKRNTLFRDFFEIDASAEKVAEKIRYYDVVCNNINEKTGLNIDTYEIYYLILGSLGVDFAEINLDKLDQFYRESEELFLKYKPTLIYPDIQGTLKDMMSEGVTTNVLSNTGFIKGYSMKKLLSFYDLDDCFSFQVYSDECGYSKPNAEIFRLVYDTIKTSDTVSKSDILHVGDNKMADYDGAKKFGFQALLVENK